MFVIIYSGVEEQVNAALDLNPGGCLVIRRTFHGKYCILYIFYRIHGMLRLCSSIPSPFFSWMKSHLPRLSASAPLVAQLALLDPYYCLHV